MFDYADAILKLVAGANRVSKFSIIDAHKIHDLVAEIDALFLHALKRQHAACLR